MRNKGRRHKSGRGPWANGDCKGDLCGITRDIHKMSSPKFKRWDHSKNTVVVKGKSRKEMKRSWSKRVRGYFKSQTKDILNGKED